jgi:hydroxymethylbilane synthase
MIRIGTRGSALARWQAELVKSLLAAQGHEAELEIITTTGDRVQDRPLESVGGKGAFLKEIEEALLAGHVDLAVHSLKDVPVEQPEGLRLVAMLERADPRDALLSRDGIGLDALPPGARLGTTSLRRRAQVLSRRPELSILDLRGNVDTRIRKLREGQFDAIILAMAGLVRLERAHEVSEPIEPEILLPAPGQGAIALETRESDERVASCVAPLHHAATAAAVAAERALLRALGGGCNVPLGAYAQPREAGGLRLRALVARPDGSVRVEGELTGDDPETLGKRLADDLLSRGAGPLLEV